MNTVMRLVIILDFGYRNMVCFLIITSNNMLVWISMVQHRVPPSKFIVFLHQESSKTFTSLTLAKEVMFK